MLEEGSSFSYDLTTCKRNEGNGVAPSFLILYNAWALDRQRSKCEKKTFRYDFIVFRTVSVINNCLSTLSIPPIF